MIKIVKIIIVAHALFLFGSAFGQKESTWWYFRRNAGVQFEQGSPVADTNANDSAHYNGIAAAADITSISDSVGSLLFYASYTGVFNRIHQTMPNGILNDDVFTSGASSSQAEQSTIIIPRPNHPEEYYFIYGRTALQEYPDTIVGGTFYNLIDMSLDGGLGDIVDSFKNVYLIDSTDEKITATPHANGVDYWLMLRRSGQGQFCAFIVTEDGVSHDPVISTLGNIASIYSEYEGNLRFNHAGDRLVHLYPNQTIGNAFEYFDFDNSTGVVSNMRLIDPTFVFGNGIEFSPDDSKLYIGGPSQFDVTTPTVSAIEASEVFLGNFITSMSGLQLGLDGKIYGNAYDGTGAAYYLNVINNPNEAGAAAGYQDSAVYLEGKRGGINLPQFLPSYFKLNFYADTICVGEPAEFTMNFTFIDSVLWNFGDPESGANDTSTALAPSHVYNEAGTYTVTLIAQNGIKTDTVIKTVYVKTAPEIDIGPDAGICMTSQDTVRFASGLGSKKDRQGIYSWSVNDSLFSNDSVFLVDSAALRPFPELNSGKLSVTLSFENECGTDLDTALLYPAYPLSVSLPPLLTSCSDTILIEANVDSITAPTMLYWFNKTDSTDPVVVKPPLSSFGLNALLGEHSNISQQREFPINFAAENACGVYTDSTILIYIPVPDGVLPADSLHCSTDSFYLYHPQTPLVNYRWSNGSTDSAYLVNGSATISLNSSSGCGELLDSFTVQIITFPERILPSDTVICFAGAQTVILSANPLLGGEIGVGSLSNLNYTWSTGATTSEIIITEIGDYSLTVSAGQCVQTDNISITLPDDCEDRCKPLPPNIITPDGDGINDVFSVKVNCVVETFELLVFNRWGVLLHESQSIDNGLWWDAVSNGSPVPDGTYFYIINVKEPDTEAVEYTGSVTVVR